MAKRYGQHSHLRDCAGAVSWKSDQAAASHASAVIFLGALALFALAQIIVGSSHAGPWRSAVGIEISCSDGNDAAVLAHFEYVEPPRAMRVHPMLTRELFHHALDRALDPERLAAANTVKRLFFLEHA